MVTESAYDETAGLYDVLATMAQGDGPSAPTQSDATGGDRSAKGSGGEAKSSKVVVAQLGAHEASAALPFTPRDAGMMGLAAAVLAGSGVLTFAAGVVRGRQKPERYDEI